MTIDLAVTLLLALINNAGKISELIQRAQTEGRDITPAEWQSVISQNDAARAALATEIEKQGG